MDKIIVGIAEGRIARGKQVLISYALGSCVGICLYDRRLKLAGMAHIVLPDLKFAADHSNAYEFAGEGVSLLVSEMKRCGALPSEMTAKIAGGANMFGAISQEWAIGERNVKAVKQALREEGIRLVAEDTGKNYGRTITFSAEDGKLTVNTVKHNAVVL